MHDFLYTILDKKSECITDVNKTEWTSTGSSTDVPHNICYSGKAFTATRQKSSSEQELGQFCELLVFG